MKTTAVHTIIGVLLALGSAPAVALEIYQWTDEDGVVHFSQVAPENEQDRVTTLDVLGQEELGSDAAVSEDDDPFGYKAHREEMDALWADIEKRRESARERQATEPAPQIVYVREEASYPYIYPGYGYRPPHRPPGRPPHRPRPPRPEEPDVVVPRPATLKRP